MSNNASSRQVPNRNFLYPTGFKLEIARAPTVGYFGQQANIPAMTLGVVEQPSYAKMIPRAGDIIEFDDLTLNFLVDEDLGNYMEIQNWMRGMGFPEDLQEIYDWQNSSSTPYVPNVSGIDLYSSGVLSIFDSNNQTKIKVVFEHMFPYYLTTVQFDATVTELQPLTAQVSFKYTIYNFKGKDENC